jgi:hypothetical protein
VAEIPSLDERDEFNRLTTIKLALQLLERRAELSERERALVRTALEATDRLGRRMLERVLERRRRAASVQAEYLQDHDDHHDRADDVQDAHLVGPPEQPPRTTRTAPRIEDRSRAMTEKRERAGEEMGKGVDFYRGLVRRWRLLLRVDGFTDEQTARLIVAKLLHRRGKLRG